MSMQAIDHHLTMKHGQQYFLMTDFLNVLVEIKKVFKKNSFKSIFTVKILS